MAINSTGRRIGAASVLAAAVAAGLGGCATTVEQEYPLANPESAKIIRGFQWLRGRTNHLGPLIVDGGATVLRDAVVLPGRRVVDVPVEWSNKFKDRTPLTIDAQPGKRYVVLAYEIDQGQNPAEVEVRRKTFWEEVSSDSAGGCMGPGCGLLLLIALPFIIHELSKDPPRGRPFDGCCFVWIQDAESAQVVAGNGPRTPKP